MFKYFIAVLVFLLASFAIASGYFSFKSAKRTIHGTECVIVKAGSGVGVSCDWD